MRTLRAVFTTLFLVARPILADPVWSEPVGDFRWTLDASGLHVSKKGNLKTVWSRDSFETAAATERGCSIHGRFRVVSLVGPYLTYEVRRDETCPPTQGKTESVEWSVVHASRPGAEHGALLTELFSETEVFQALRNHPLLGAPKTKSIPAPIRSLAGIESQLGATLFVFERANQQCFAAFDRVLERFALWKLERERVLVRLQVPLEGSPACSQAPLELDLSLKVSPYAKRILELAESRREGFTAHQSETVQARLEMSADAAQAPASN